MKTFLKGGYYTTRMKTRDGQVHNNVNIVAINTQACYHWNYDLFANRNDPGDEL